jgi:hypothetical protein
MSHTGQKPEHLLIRDYITGLQDQKKITREALRDAFVPAYLDMVPPGDDAPHFEAVHRHDTVTVMRRKEDANTKKLWRAIDGTTFFPLAFKAPLIVALDALGNRLGYDLQALLLHNAGLAHIPIDTSGKAPAIYAELLKEFAELNTAVVDDMADDNILNSKNTREQLLDSMDKHLALLRELDRNCES